MSRPRRSPNSARECEMVDAEMNAYHDLRDPLWRLAPTPFNLKMSIGRLVVLVESNDPQVLVNLAKMNSQKSSNAEPAFLWRIIRDPEAEDEIEPVALIVDGDLSFLKMGTGIFAGVDEERRELLGFMGTGVSDHAFLECVAPLFVQLTLDAARNGARRAMGALEFALARDNGNA
jgi:hypothetical protein